MICSPFRLSTSAQVAIRFSCAVCGKICENSVNVIAGADWFLQEEPGEIQSGYWQRLGTSWVCNDHKLEIVVKVDGEVVEILPSLNAFPWNGGCPNNSEIKK
jgi:hypothetical protein